MEVSQAEQPFRLETPLGKDALVLVSWEGEERVSSLFRFTVVAWSERSDIAAKDLLFKAVTLHLKLPDGSDRSIHGVVSRLTGGATAPNDLTAYELEIRPPHWLLTLDSGFNIHQSKSVREIGDAVLAGTPYDWKLVRTMEPRPYCFQYRESRWSFLSRLVEQEGIWYRYDHKGGVGKLVLCDSVASAQPAWGVTELLYSSVLDAKERLKTVTIEALPIVAETRIRSASEFLSASDVSNVVAAVVTPKPPTDVKVYDFDQQLAAHRSGIGHGGAETASDGSKLTADTKVYARIRQEYAESMALSYRGVTNYVGLEAGAKTDIKKHPSESMNVSLFVTAVVHRGHNAAYFSADEEGYGYENQFEAIPAERPYRPARVTPWPRVAGSHVGTVVGPDGEEIYTDKHGRVQVVFKWDTENARALERSCWIRVAQPFAGQNFGAVFLPRIGHEVLVEFLDGNPDNPVVVGSLYNSANLPPWKLPDNKSQSGIRTKSTLKGGADDFNELRFEDKKGDELLYVQAQKDMTTLVKNDRTTTVKRHDVRTVEEGNDTHTVKKGEQTITVEDNNRTLHVEKNHKVTVNGEESITVTKDRTVLVKAKQSHEVTSDNTLTVKGKQTTKVTGNDATTVEQGNATREVQMGNISEKASMGNITIKAELGAITIEAMQKVELKVGGSSVTIDMSGVTIKGPMIKIEGQGMAQIKAPMTQVNGDGMLMLKGGITMIN